MKDPYRQINLAIDYIEQHLEDQLKINEVARLVGMSVEVFRVLFSALTQNTFAEYLRKRRLTLAARDLLQTNQRVIDLANKYQYTSAAAFSRAFLNFHGILPSEARREPHKLCFFAKIILDSPATCYKSCSYEIVERNRLNLYGLFVDTDNARIDKDAPQLFLDIAQHYPSLAHPDYGILHYRAGRENLSHYRYWVLWEADKILKDTKERVSLQHFTLSGARFLKFLVPSQEAADIQSSSHYFYERFWPDCNYRFAEKIDLEHYHNGVTDFLVPIEHA